MSEDSFDHAVDILKKTYNDLSEKLRTDHSRRRGSIHRRMHNIRRMLLGDYPYRSQAGQDYIIDRETAQVENGTFIDIGGYDGVSGSNTLFFEQIRGWNGVIIEPVPVMAAKAKRARKSDVKCCAVGAQEGEAEFLAVTEGYKQMSGLVNQYDPDVLKVVRKNEKHAEELIKVKVVTLAYILTESGIMNPDFVSLDIEGGELDVLQNFPFANHEIKYWAIENNTRTPEIRKIMNANGYKLFDFCGEDELYVKRS